MSEEKNPPRAQIFRYFHKESRNKTHVTLLAFNNPYIIDGDSLVIQLPVVEVTQLVPRVVRRLVKLNTSTTSFVFNEVTN